MKSTFSILILFLFFTGILSEKYFKIPPASLMNFLRKESIYVIDIRDNSISSRGFIPNSLIQSYPVGYFKQTIPMIVEKRSNVVVITDNESVVGSVANTTKSFGFNFLGYSLFDEVSSYFSLEVAEFNENTKKDVEKLVKEGQLIIDIREVYQYKETGVIKEAVLIPFSTFKTDFEKRIPRDRNVYVYCTGGGRALLAMTYAKRLGYPNKFIVMRRGITKIKEEGYPFVPYPGN